MAPMLPSSVQVQSSLRMEHGSGSIPSWSRQVVNSCRQCFLVGGNQVADGLSGTGRKVTLLSVPWMEGFASKTVANVIGDAAAGKGVSILDSKLEGAVGCGHV